MSGPSWSRSAKARFYINYILARVGLLWTVRKPKFRFFFYELKYAVLRVVNAFFAQENLMYSGPTLIETSQGVFSIREHTHDATLVSPAYECDDIEFANKILSDLTDRGAQVGFIDIGANIGAFTVRVSRRHRGKGFQTWSVEPIPDNLKMLKKNLELNHLGDVHVLPFALSDASADVPIAYDSREGGNATLHYTPKNNDQVFNVKAIRGDELFSNLPENLLLKIDVEGHEASVLRGMTETLRKSKTCWVCIEDGKDAAYECLRDAGFKFQTKLTPYNSWWSKGALHADL